MAPAQLEGRLRFRIENAQASPRFFETTSDKFFRRNAFRRVARRGRLFNVGRGRGEKSADRVRQVFETKPILVFERSTRFGRRATAAEFEPPVADVFEETSPILTVFDDDVPRVLALAVKRDKEQERKLVLTQPKFGGKRFRLAASAARRRVFLGNQFRRQVLLGID